MNNSGKLNIERIFTITALLTIFLFLSLVFSTQAIYAAIWNKNELIGKPRHEKVDIELESYLLKDGKLTLVNDPTMIKAGEDTAYVPYIVNIGDKCNLRIRMFANTQKQKKINILKYCYGKNDSWIVSDGWFYLKTKFSSNAKIKICDGFKFPDEWNWKERENNILNITIEAEAVADEDMPPKTGDHNALYLYIGLAVISTISLLLILLNRRRRYR